MFLAFQYPVEIPGVSNANFLRKAAQVKAGPDGQAELDTFDFLRSLTRADGSCWRWTRPS